MNFSVSVTADCRFSVAVLSGLCHILSIRPFKHGRKTDSYTASTVNSNTIKQLQCITYSGVMNSAKIIIIRLLDCAWFYVPANTV